MAIEMIPVRFLQFPTFYIRKKPNEEIVEQWASELKEGAKIREPIEVWVPTEKDHLDKGKRYEITDGYKRVLACLKAGVKEIPAVVKPFKDHAEAFARQYQTAEQGSEFLNRAQRNHYVTVMRETFKLSLEQIASVTKISKSQVSRIARGVKAKPKAGGKPGRKAKRFTVKGFLEEVRFLGITYQNYKESVDKYVSDKDGALSALFKALEKVLPHLAQEEPEEA